MEFVADMIPLFYFLVLIFIMQISYLIRLDWDHRMVGDDIVVTVRSFNAAPQNAGIDLAIENFT